MQSTSARGLGFEQENAELQKIDPQTMNELRTELGLGNKDVPQLSVDEKVSHHRPLEIPGARPSVSVSSTMSDEPELARNPRMMDGNGLGQRLSGMRLGLVRTADSEEAMCGRRSDTSRLWVVLVSLAARRTVVLFCLLVVHSQSLWMQFSIRGWSMDADSQCETGLNGTHGHVAGLTRLIPRYASKLKLAGSQKQNCPSPAVAL